MWPRIKERNKKKSLECSFKTHTICVNFNVFEVCLIENLSQFINIDVTKYECNLIFRVFYFSLWIVAIAYSLNEKRFYFSRLNDFRAIEMFEQNRKKSVEKNQTK